MRILCLQHVPFEGPAALANRAQMRGHSVRAHPLYESKALPSVGDFDCLLIMGGPMNIYEESKYPWLAAEKALIREAITAGKYVFGICLGGQLIADALGATVSPGAQPEMGWYPIHNVDKRVLAWQCQLEATPESLAARAEACGDELTEGEFIMPAERLPAEPTTTYARMLQALFDILDHMTAPIEVLDWGRTEYAEAFARQKERVDQRRAGECGDALIFTEHAPVYTLGMRKDSEQHLIWAEAECARQGIDVIQSNRGGDITYHGPGQIVGYPILSLAHRKDLHAYLRDLEEVVIRTLITYGLAAARRAGKTGIWLENERKICAIGVAVRSWITYHGFALNVCPDMTHFDGIVPCGITDGSVTSLANELDKPINIAEVKARLAVEFESVFGNSG